MIPTPDRSEPALDAAERPMLTGWLDYHRATLARKCAGLSAEQLRERAVPPSALSLLGLVRHMAEVELGWFRQVMAGEPVADLYVSPEHPDADFEVADADVEEAFATWWTQCDRSRAIEAGFGSLDDLGTGSGRRVSLRWVLTHMIEEYARHNGHADLLRERLDGQTGD